MDIHKLSIEKIDNIIKIKLDDFNINNVLEYKVTSSANGLTELDLKICVSDLKIDI